MIETILVIKSTELYEQERNKLTLLENAVKKCQPNPLVGR